MLGAIGEEHSVFDIVFLVEFTKDYLVTAVVVVENSRM